MTSKAEASHAPRASMEDLVSLCARRGFIFQSSEIYGGINGFWDYGPLGVELKNNLKEFWWQRTVRDREDVEGLDSAIIAHPRTWEASGHVEHFSDPMVDCRACKKRFRADQLDEVGPCSAREGSSEHDFTESRSFNLMLRTRIGASEDAASTAYLRAETCGSIFTGTWARPWRFSHASRSVAPRASATTPTIPPSTPPYTLCLVVSCMGTRNDTTTAAASATTAFRR